MKQKGKIQIGEMVLDAEVEMEVQAPKMSEDAKTEIGQMVREGVSYTAFVEFGKPPEPANVVEGSIVKEDQPVKAVQVYKGQ